MYLYYSYFVTESNCIIFGTVSEYSDVLLLLSVPQRVGSHCVGLQVRELRNVFEDSKEGVEVWTPVEEGLRGGGAGGGDSEPAGQLLV